MQENIQDKVPLSLSDIRPEIADGAGGFGHCLPIFNRGTCQQPAVGLDKGCRVGTGGAEVEQDQLAGGPVVAIVGKIGVGLDQSKFENLPEEEPEEQSCDTIALRLRSVQQGFYRYALHAGDGQDILRRQISVHLGQQELGRVGK